jgi:cyclopropane fatty-acyl-phospholipid synthase-like methyltransferase
MSEMPLSTVLSAKDLKRISDEKETARLREILDRRKKEEAEEHRARQDFLEREVKPEGIERFNAWVRRAAEQGRSEIQILRFPSQYCTDHGRAINNLEADWPQTLTGFAAKIYEAHQKHLQAQGYTIRAQILNYPDGGLGEVGIYIGW